MSVRHRIEAVRVLARHYGATFSYCWQRRHQDATGIFNQTEAEFMPAHLSLQEAPDSPTLRWTGRVLMLLVACTLIWSVWGRVDIVVNASGKVIPSTRTQTIASVDVASVRALHVMEGQRVERGQLLLELDSSSSDAEHDKAAVALAQARLQIARATGLIDAVRHLRPPNLERVEGAGAAQQSEAARQLDSEYRDFRAKLARIDGDIARFAEALPLAAQRAQDYRELSADSTVSRHAWLEREQARVDLQGQLTDAHHQREALIAQTMKDANDSLAEGRRIVGASEQDRRRAGEHSKLLRLVSPVEGTVQQLGVHTVGGVVPAAQPLMQIVPLDAPVEIEAWLENRDIGFLREGQAAEVKIDAFDYTRYGTVPARVAHVSRDAIQDEKRGPIYSARIVLDRPTLVVEGQPMRLTAGLSAAVEIKTGTRRVIEYVLSPLMKHGHEALRER